jgi:hypothetical protein
MPCPGWSITAQYVVTLTLIAARARQGKSAAQPGRGK